MKVVITGAGGQLGRALIDALSGHDVVALDRARLDITDVVGTRTVLAGARPDVVINAAAFTRVDDCEHEPELAFRVNTHAVRHLAQACADLDCLLVHISTDYVFDGTKGRPYTEDDPPNPLSVYGASKLAGESFVRHLVPRHYVVRTSGLYGVRGTGGRENFVDAMLRLAGEGGPIRVVADQVLTPTSTRDLARKIAALLSTDKFGLYHITNAGQCSWFEFAAAIFRFAGIARAIEPTTGADLARPARRPRYSVLAHTRLAALGADDLPPWEDALARYLRERTGRLPEPGLRPSGRL